MLIYVAGKYSGDVDANIAAARSVTAELWVRGHAVICPHMNSARIDEYGADIGWEGFLRGGENMISRCDALVMLPNWQDSKGAVREEAYATRLGIPVWYYPELPALHPTEIKCPEQVEAFREIIGRMYRTHLNKNEDYSPINLQWPGDLGIAVRLWDKVARMMNLIGFDITIASTEFRQPKIPKYEALHDTFLDLAVYGVIGQIMRSGKWGK